MRRSLVAFMAVVCVAGCMSSPPPEKPLARKSRSVADATTAPTSGATRPTEPLEFGVREPAPPKGACGRETTSDDCFACCYDDSPLGVERYATFFWSCACERPAACARACASSYCAGEEADDECFACLRAATLCDEAAGEACAADAACAPLLACASESECSSKEDEETLSVRR